MTKNDYLYKFLAWFFYLFGRFLHATYRYRYCGLDNLIEAQKHHPAGTFCLASWHEHTISGILGQKGVPYCLVVSPSRDGDFVQFIAQKFGYKAVRGSSSRGGADARKNLEKVMSKGFPAAFTVDGPKGPRHKCKPGVLRMAQKLETVILPVAAVAQDPWVLHKTWDKTKLPKPFSKVIYQFGEVIQVPEHIEGEEFELFLKKIEQELFLTEKKAYQNLKEEQAFKKRIPANILNTYQQRP